MVIGIKTKFVEITPSDPLDVPINALFLDETNSGQATFKNAGGSTAVIGAVTSTNLFVKQMQIDQPIAINDPVAKKPSGRIIKADSDLSADSQNYIGVALTAGAAIGDFINVLLIGTNLVGALAGLGFTPGQFIYLGENGGFTNQAGLSGFSGSNDIIIRVGVADCGAGVATAMATDLIAITQIVSIP